MTLELGGIVALAALMIGLIAWLRADMHREIGGLRGEIAQLRTEMAELRTEMAELRERMARMEGMFEVLARAVELPRTEAAAE
ncbi:MAG: DNA replication initiation control protein YabA [Rhodospirillaceae bacterium]|nr:DNA replication initiation control protein YabA [Rhodospirillaceae bacterium]MYK14266.1 DNA replication initiation control protein YabA [Rhodospirillaceae bacterium]